MSVYGITWDDINGNSIFVFDANINSVRTWITVSTDTTESTARKFQVTMYRGVAGGGQVEVTTLTAKYVRTENNVKLYQAEYIFNVADWIQFRPNDNNYVTVWVNTPESLYTSATVKFMYMPTINSIRITSNLPDSSIFVQNVTPFNIEVEAEGYDGATIQAVTADIQSTANPLTEVGGVWVGTRNAYTSYRTVEFWVRATDQYQVTKLQTVKVSVKKHDVPAITTDIYRCDLDGTKNENGAYLSVTAYASSVPTALGIYSLYLEGTIIGASSSIIAQYINSGQTYILGNGGITSNDSYNLTFTATDKSASYGGTALTTSVTVGVPKVVRVINVKDGGKGVAFGKVAETDNLVDSEWGIRSGGDVTATANLHIEATATSNPTLFFENENADRRAFVQYNKANRRVRFQCYSQNSETEEPLGYYEVYDLPATDQDRTGHASYKIITTKNISDIPDASATAAGKVNTGAQTFAGAKTFNGIAKFRSSEGTPEVHFVSKSNDPADYNGIMYLATPLTGSNRRTDRFIFREMSYNSSTGARLTNYENYQLPSVNADRTSNATYNILTTKETATAGTITPASGWTLSSYSYLKKWGEHFVEFYVELTGGAYSTNGWNTVATFSAGFRPSTTFDFIGLDNGASTQSNLGLDCKMASSGLLRVYKSATMTPTNNIRIHGTFII